MTSEDGPRTRALTACLNVSPTHETLSLRGAHTSRTPILRHISERRRKWGSRKGSVFSKHPGFYTHRIPMGGNPNSLSEPERPGEEARRGLLQPPSRLAGLGSHRSHFPRLLRLSRVTKKLVLHLQRMGTGTARLTATGSPVQRRHFVRCFVHPPAVTVTVTVMARLRPSQPLRVSRSPLVLLHWQEVETTLQTSRYRRKPKDTVAAVSDARGGCTLRTP